MTNGFVILLLPVIDVDNFGIFSTLSGVNCGQFWYFSTLSGLRTIWVYLRKINTIQGFSLLYQLRHQFTDNFVFKKIHNTQYSTRDLRQETCDRRHETGDLRQET